MAQCRSGGATPALPLLKILPTSRSPSFLPLAPPFPQNTGKEMLTEPSLSPPQPRPPPVSFFPYSSSLLSHFSLLTTTDFFFYNSDFLHFSQLSPLLSCLTLLNQQHVGLMETRPRPILLKPAGFSLVDLISLNSIYIQKRERTCRERKDTAAMFSQVAEFVKYHNTY